MAIRDDFEVAAGQVRAAVQRFALGLLVLAAFGAMLIGKADSVLVENARVLALDLASPVLEAIARPGAAANLAIADLNSRLPVVVERTRERAILAGDNSPQLRLTLLQSVAGVQRGDRIITSGHGGSFPVGIPVGEVVETGEGGVRVKPFADFSRLEFVRVVDYGVTHPVSGRSRASAAPAPPRPPAPGQGEPPGAGPLRPLPPPP